MKRITLRFALLLGWLSLFYHIERLPGPINISPFTYSFVTLVAGALVIVPGIQNLRSRWVFLLPAALFLLTKSSLGYPIAAGHLEVTVSELCALELTVLTAWLVRQALEEFQGAVSDLMVSQLSKAQPFETGQGEIYREVRRARSYRRPLALLAIAPDRLGETPSFSRLLVETQREMLEQYAAARLENLLSEELKDWDIIARRNSHFITVLPGADDQTAEEIAKRLEMTAQRDLGMKVRIGVAAFPNQEVTFQKLLERAETRMCQNDTARVSERVHATPDKTALSETHVINPVQPELQFAENPGQRNKYGRA